ncbi:MAG TPA: VWA domain-containing protein [Vicinamibacterales bacterium]|nr:VWA domain-containing protein [Vicinamibacterales bacterium]
MARPIALLAVFALMAPAVAGAQDTAPPTFKSGVDLVRFDVRVIDGDGRPVTDLRPEEITITDAGTNLPIVLFQRVTEPAGSYVQDALRATTAEVSSNAAFPRGHLYILIFDQQHLTPGNEQRARVAAESFIRRRVRPSDRVALFALPGPGPRLGFTADKSRAIESLASIRGMRDHNVATTLGNMTAYEAHRVVAGDAALAVSIISRMGSETGDVVTGLRDVGAGRGGGGGVGEAPMIGSRTLVDNARALINQSDSESRQFLQQLADVVSAFRDIEGRKTVVLFSEGFIQDNLTRELEVVAAAAAQSYCVFYTMDLNPRTPALSQAFTSDTAIGPEIQARIAPLSTLAVETDGAMIVDASMRSGAELDKIADTTQDYYLVGFTPPAAVRGDAGQYRRVNVRVRRPGVRVSARTGYAVAPPATSVQNRRLSLDRVLAAPFVQQGLRVDYTTYVLKGTESGRQRVVLSLSTDLPVRSRPNDAADVVFVVRDARDGRVVESGTGAIPLPAAARPDAQLGSGSWRVQFSLPPGSYVMRSVVREPGGLAGSTDRRLDVRALDAPEVTVSDLIVASAISGLPVRPRAYTATGLSALLETYARTAAQLDGIDVTVDLRREDGGESLTSLKADLLPTDQDGDGFRRRVQVLLPLTGTPPGGYIARAVVRARGEVIGERTRQVEILAGVAPALTDHSAPAANTWTPLEIVSGDLAQRYIAWLRGRAAGTPAAALIEMAAAHRWEQLELALRGAQTADPVIAPALAGLALFVREEYIGAAAALARAANAAPDNALTAFFQGWAHDGAGDWRAALSSWRRAAHLDSSLISAHLALADGYLKIGEPALAVQALRAGLTAQPASVELQGRLQQIERTRQ